MEHSAHDRRSTTTITELRPDSELTRVVDLIAGGQRFVVTGHMSPDGDVLGSMSALTGVLRRAGKEVIVFNRDPAPERYSFLPFMDELVTELPPGRLDGAFIVDCCEPGRVRADFEDRVRAAGGALVAIDHHATPLDEVDFGFHDEDAAATGVLVYRLARTLGIDVDAEIGQGVYVALITDTGNFRYSNTGPEAFSIASELVARGVDPHRISQRIYENEPLPRMKLLGEALERMELSHGGRVAWMLLPDGIFERLDATPDLLDGTVDYGRQVAGVEVACLIRRNTGVEAGDRDLFRVSLRSSGTVDVEAIAARLGGGGHRMAAGCRMPAPSLDAAAARVRVEVELGLAVLPPLPGPAGPASA